MIQFLELAFSIFFFLMAWYRYDHGLSWEFYGWASLIFAVWYLIDKVAENDE